MNTDEQALIDGLFARLKQAEAQAEPRDVQAQQRIAEHIAGQPAAPYYMAQAILVQEAALKRLDEQNKDLQAQLSRAQAQPADSARQQGGGFLSSLFGSGTRDTPPAPASANGGWREPGRSSAAPVAAPAPQAYAPPPAAAPAGGGFMRGALQTAAGVAGGVMLAEGISSLFHHNSAPQEVVEVLQEAPAPVSDSPNWNDEPAAQDSFADNDYSADEGGGFFSDDDDYV